MAHAAGISDPEVRLKAAVVSKFPEFVEWPASVLEQRSTIELCVVGPSLFGPELSALVDGKQVGGRAYVVREIADVRAVDSCHMLLLAGVPAAQRLQYLARSNSRPILTVSDADGFLAEGGLVGLRLIDGRVRFDINLVAAGGAGLRFSSQLLRLAVVVRRGTL